MLLVHMLAWGLQLVSEPALGISFVWLDINYVRRVGGIHTTYCGL
jgi:hypothetical protein